MEYWKNLSLLDIIYTDRKGVTFTEVWKDIEGFEGYYQVSDLGRVKYTGKPYVDSIGRFTPKKERIRVQTVGKKGYLILILRSKGKNISCRVHRLVAETFIENSDNKCCVNHKNLIKTDNSLLNLEWVSVRENSKHWIENDNNIISNYIGIRYIPKYNYWKAHIQIEKENFLLGVFENEIEAKNRYEEVLSNWEKYSIKPIHNNRSRFSSNFKGIYLNKDIGKWTAQFFKDSKFFHVGNYNTEEEAKKAYDNIETEYEKTKIFPTKKYASIYKFVNYLRGKWQANALNVEGKSKKYLGIFKTEEEAAERIKEYLGLNSIEELLR